MAVVLPSQVEQNVTRKVDVTGPLRTLDEFTDIPEGIDHPTLVGMFKQFARAVSQMMTGHDENTFAMRAFWRAGDIKVSLRRSKDQMPGFILWDRKLVLSRREYPKLFEIVGDGGSRDPETFIIEDPRRGFLRAWQRGQRIGFDPGTETEEAEGDVG